MQLHDFYLGNFSWNCTVGQFCRTRRSFSSGLMGNHTHRLSEIGERALSKVMQNILFRYTAQAFGGHRDDLYQVVEERYLGDAE